VKTNSTFLSALIALLVAGCGQSEAPQAQPPAADANQATAEAHAQAQRQAEATRPTAAKNRGIVIGAKVGGGYSYIEVDVGGNQRVWLAASQIDVQPGEKISWGDYAVMSDFTSKALGQTFPQILFVSRVVKGWAASPSSNQGRVVSVTPSAGYNYIEVQQGGGNTWLAAPMTPVKVGNTITWSGGSTMKDFTSSSLKRTFESIIFVGAVQVLN